MIEVARELHIHIPESLQEQRQYFLITEPMENLGVALAKFQRAQQLLYSESVLERLAFETVLEAAQENTKLLELRYAPTFIQEAHSHLSWDHIHQSFLRGIQKAQNQHSIAVGLILIIQRTLPKQNAESIVDFAINNKNTILGIDLADNENGFDGRPFANSFQRAKSAGLHITVHAGEVPTPQSVTNIQDAVELLGAERIGHGIQAIHSESLMQWLVKKNISLEVCPTSNYLTQIVPHLREHPLRKLYEAGLSLTINTDDPGIFNYSLSDELLVTANELGFSEFELREFQKNGFIHSFIPNTDKQPFNAFFEVP